MEAFSVDSPVAVMEALKRRVGASRSPSRTIEAVQRRELGLDVGKASGGGHARKEAQCRRRRTQKDTLERRVVRAMGLAQLGELSNARHALEGEADTRKVLTDKKRRPPVAREPIGNDILGRTPDVPLDFDVDRLLKNLSEARKGSAAGPSGMTSEHLKPLL